jgi:hypothetical protein
MTRPVDPEPGHADAITARRDAGAATAAEATELATMEASDGR